MVSRPNLFYAASDKKTGPLESMNTRITVKALMELASLSCDLNN